MMVPMRCAGAACVRAAACGSSVPLDNACTAEVLQQVLVIRVVVQLRAVMMVVGVVQPCEIHHTSRCGAVSVNAVPPYHLPPPIQK